MCPNTCGLKSGNRLRYPIKIDKGLSTKVTTITFGTQTVVTTVRLKPQADASSIDNCQRK